MMRKRITGLYEIIKTRINSFIVRSDLGHEERRKRIIFAFFILVSIPVFFAFCIHYFRRGDLTRFFILLFIAVIQSISFLSLRYFKNTVIIYGVNVVLLGCYVFYRMIHGGEKGAGILWMNIFPLFVFFLLGKKVGLLLGIITFLLYLMLLIDPNSIIGTFPYESEFKVRSLVIFGLLILMGYIVESARQRYQDGMESKQLELQSEIKERIQSEEELKKYRCHLEELVQQRTSELTITNEKLMKEVEERKGAEEALREAYDIINKSPAVAFLWKNEEGWPVQFASENVENLFGYTAEQFVSSKVDYASIIHPDDLEKVAREVLRFSQEQGRIRFTHEPYRIVTQDGTVKWLDDRTYIRRDEKGKITHYQGIVEDITERLKIEDALRASEANYRAIFDTANDAIFVHEIETGAILDVNRKMTEMYGYTIEEAQQINVRIPSAEEPPYTQENAFRWMRKAVEGEPQLFEWKAKDKAGRIFWVEVNLKRVTLGGKDRLLAIVRDTTERKRAEEALRKSEERYRLLAENATDVIWTIDMDLNITYISPSVKQARGYTVEEAMAQTIPEIFTPESLAVAVRALEEELAIERRESKDLNRSRTLELEYKCKDGSTIWSEVKYSFIRDSSGRAIGILAVGRNITERRKAEKEKTDLQQQLQQAQRMEAVGRLAGGIAHDFNNLLTVIKGYCDLALMGLKEEGPLKRALEEINRAGDRAAILTHQLLAFSRRQILESKIVNLNEILRSLNKMLQRLIGEDIELVTILGEGLGKVKVDPGQMEQVIMNLAVNARDAMPMGGKLILETSNVELGEKHARNHVDLKPGSYVMLSVRDFGIGIPSEVMEHIFEPFFTTKERGKGTGLGLSMVYGMVNQSGGVIGVESEVGQGTTFKIYFPRVVGRAEGMEAGPVKQEIPQGSETILVVEDDEGVRDLAIQILKKQGYRVFEASCGEEALDLYGVIQEPIHLVLTDVVMPQMSGRELADHLVSVHPEMKLLYMSGYTDDAIVQHGILEEGVNYIQKPFTMEGLAKKVREVLDKEVS
jgi:PAS domain S-box-containing protein